MMLVLALSADGELNRNGIHEERAGCLLRDGGVGGGEGRSRACEPQPHVQLHVGAGNEVRASLILFIMMPSRIELACEVASVVGLRCCKDDFLRGAVLFGTAFN